MKTRLILSVCLLVCIASISLAQVPQTMSYKGVLKNADETLVPDGTYNLTLTIYDAETDGTSLWTETLTVPVTDGLFSVILGEVNPLNIQFDSQHWIGLSINGGTELTPRTKLTSVPYSLKARSLSDNSVTTDKIAGQSVTAEKISPTGASSGQMLSYDGSQVTWATPPSGGGLTLPFSGNASGTEHAFKLTHSGSGNAIHSINTGTGRAGVFQIDNTGNSYPALNVSTNGSGIALRTFTNGSGHALSAFNAGTGQAGHFTINNTGSSNHALFATTNGTGNAGYFEGKLTATNIIESTSGGFKFPDGTVLVSGTVSIADLSDGSTSGGSYNLFIGTSAGSAIQSGGGGNIGLGYEAMKSTTTGDQNTATGCMALYSNTTGNYNTASGFRALYSNTEGNFNTAIGECALYYNTDGKYNTASGHFALRNNSSGNNNTASGREALYSNTTGIANTASGFEALYKNTTGYANTASGQYALYSNTTGIFNTASGVDALYSNTTGQYNTASGEGALYSNTTGHTNTSSGFYAGNDITTGNSNVIIGFFSNPSSADAVNQIVIGYGAKGHGDNRVVIGNGDVTNWEPHGDNAVDLGHSSYRFDDVYATNGTIQTSDVRLKKEIKESDLGLNFINQINPVSYRWKDNDNGKHYGLIAQELVEVLKTHGLESVDEIAAIDWDESSDRYGLRYTELIAPMIKAIQELSAKVEELESQLNNLKGTDLANSK